MNYVFASGSPFPAFPPRRVPGPNGDLEPLVDGGYSNLVPIEAAANLDAVQALVVHSSNPLPPPAEPGVLANLAGPLVHNVPRLFGFLYQRSQQLDRRSRSLLFVVSLAPPYRADWPLLTDFRRATVARMVEAADEAFEERIGLVESWGPPLVQFHVTVPSKAAAEG
jgi:predicted acylesterase/phospholipase RssA